MIRCVSVSVMRIMTRTLLIVAALVLGGLVIVGCASRGSYETAPYKVTKSDGAFEIREYPSLTVASTNRGGDNDSFMKLFRYIDGANEQKEKISMTTPVFMENGEMSFVMPEKAKTGTPKPANQQVEIKTLPARKLAVYRYNGRATRANEQEAEKKLKAWLAENKLSHADDSVVAYYDPPWTLPPLRRNEVLIPLK